MAARKTRRKRGPAATEHQPVSAPVEPSDLPAASISALSDAGVVEGKPGAAGHLVVGIGASAGGLEAFKKFLIAMTAESGITFVLIPHLDPRHESLMVELLARYTTMPVMEAADGMVAEVNRVIVIPPNKYMTIADGVLHLTGPVERSGPQTSIDLFFRSLAQDKQEKAICIILSGTGSHGSLGLKAIKAAAGMAMVQDPSTSEYPQMPEHAIATGMVDYVLPVEEMPARLMQYIQHPYVNGAKDGAASAETADQLNRILALLRAQSRVDFRCYRKPMLARRIERRMSLIQIKECTDYLEFLRKHPEEVQQLVRDLLISVTTFFRDPEAFQALETEVLAPLIRSKATDAPLRVWSAACATGEEAYSLGMLLLEQLALAQKHCPVQIFATDVDETALEVARQGVYPETIAADVSLERLRRFLTHSNDTSYRVSKQLREIIIFAHQNLISDAPFSKLDLIVCRNLLIYLEPEVQRKVVALLHFSLKEGGFLFLGSAETVGRHLDLFEPVDKKWRIFRRIGMVRPEHVEVPIATSGSLLPVRRAMATSSTRPVRYADLAQRLLLEEFAPAAVLINQQYEILYFFGPTDRYLTVPTGEPTHDLMLLAREGLRTKLRFAVHKVVRENSPVTLDDVQVKRNGDFYPVRVTLRPVQSTHGDDDLVLVTFHDFTPTGAAPQPLERGTEEPIVRQLEYELKVIKEDLQSTIEELESSNEELKVSNEEVMSMNEELQSTNEELETSKEELQSLNEELTTVNNQLQDKVMELETANNDMANLFDCTNVAIIFLDNQFRIKRYTPPAKQLFHLIATDLNRSIHDITPKYINSTLEQDIQEVLRTLVSQETQVQLLKPDNRIWNRRISPYRTVDNHIEGVVLTFTEVTQLRHAAEQAQRLATVLMDSNDAVTVHDLEGKILTWNRGAEQMTGYTAAEALQMNYQQMIPEVIRDRVLPYWNQLGRGERVQSWESQRLTKDGRILDVWVTATALKDESGQPVAIAKTERNITEQKRFQAHLEYEIQQRTAALRKSQEQLAAVLHTAADAIITIGATGLIESVNSATERMFGYSAAELIGQNVKMLMPPAYRIEHDRYLANYEKTGVRKIIGIGREVEAQRKDGSIFPVDLAISEVNHLRLFTGILRDITQRKQAEMALRDSAQFARCTLDGLSAHIAIVGSDGTILAVNKAWREFAVANGARPGTMEEGANYFRACAGAAGLHTKEGPLVAAGMHAVLDMHLNEFVLEYACHGPREERWFLVRVTPFPGEGPRRVVVAHENITKRKELEREVVEIASLEQRRIGQDLHDSVGQELTALNILAGDLAETLHANPMHGTRLVEQIIQGLKRSQKELRAVMRGLLPVPVDSEGLMAALSDLVERIHLEGKVNCLFDCPAPVSVADNLAATHLFLIAQEAVHNAIKHARPQNLRITLKAENLLILSVQDDGRGMPAQLTEDNGGLGLRIMHNRAAIIGATLTIQPALPTGTVVMCTMERKTR